MSPTTGTTRTVRRALSVATIAAAVASTAACTPGPESAPAPSSTTGTQESSPRPDAGTYDDGEYAARGWYGSKPSHHDVTLVIEDGAVRDVSITTPAEDETSLGYQQRFAEALPDAIIGRPIDDINVDRLAGSSGCSEGFMDALEQIREDARR